MPDVDWRQETDPRHKYRTDQLHWQTTDAFTSAFAVTTDQMAVIAGAWTLLY